MNGLAQQSLFPSLLQHVGNFLIHQFFILPACGLQYKFQVVIYIPVGKQLEILEREKEKLYAEIGRLTTQVNWLKKKYANLGLPTEPVEANQSRRK